jgi:hypothetical protein
MDIKPGPQKMPSEIQEALRPFLREANPTPAWDKVDPNADLHISTGSADNDAAMFLNDLCRDFDSRCKAIAFAEEKGWVVVEDEYEGCSY